ncbi:uncharacterized protein LOC131229406 isoform X2 [Magnolia sinica]|uniref:uncharacterized protein LOC131229406 isoform X2 n=1 Tax=Magnolia sinica TaxID=86752 RepID=UPI00265ADF60|nr:uncharacterized protein LOC131229406 isoform X2 [Magnolia sinica]
MRLQLQLQQPIQGWGWCCFQSPSPRLQLFVRKGMLGPLSQSQWRRNNSLRPHASAAIPSRTQRIMENISINAEAGGAGGAYSYNALKRLDQIWCNLCSAQPSKQETQVVSSFPGSFSQFNLDQVADTFDVLVCGGTLGIFVATALCCKGLRVAIVERNLLKGREQEWNISMKELLELVHVGILAEDDIKQAIAVEFNPNRCGFERKGDILVEDILNLGVSPAKLIEVTKSRFLSLGGIIFEGQSFSSISIYDDAAVLQLSDGKCLASRLVIDAMGNFSPVVKQIRSGRKPDGVCLVVGSCSRGFKENVRSDVIFSNSSVKKVGGSEVQCFWEAFPAGSGPTDRTTYMFTYVDVRPGCPTLEELLEVYWNLMPAYQGVLFDDLEILRVIFGIFPTYRDSPLPAAFNRILQVGDASGIQSPVSFGGFGSMTRHISRLSTGIHEAVAGNFLDSYSLSLLNPYMPNLSASWLFQRAMSARPQANVSSSFINELLYINFLCMQRLGDQVLRPFLQVGIAVILDWSVHFIMLGHYTFLSTFVEPIIRPWITILPNKMKYEWRRHVEAWKYGAGLDYK